MNVARAALTAAQELDDERAILYYDLVVMAVSTVVRRKLEDLMLPQGYEFQSDFARKYFSQGQQKGKIEALLTFLSSRGLTLDDEQREMIVGCQDKDTLDRWIERASSAESLDEIFG